MKQKYKRLFFAPYVRLSMLRFSSVKEFSHMLYVYKICCKKKYQDEKRYRDFCKNGRRCRRKMKKALEKKMKQKDLTLYDLLKKYPKRVISIRDTENQEFTTYYIWNYEDNFMNKEKCRRNFTVRKIEKIDKYSIHVLVKEKFKDETEINRRIRELLQAEA